jgi:hypothetical protein
MRSSNPPETTATAGRLEAAANVIESMTPRCVCKTIDFAGERQPHDGVRSGHARRNLGSGETTTIICAGGVHFPGRRTRTRDLRLSDELSPYSSLSGVIGRLGMRLPVALVYSIGDRPVSKFVNRVPPALP